MTKSFTSARFTIASSEGLPIRGVVDVPRNARAIVIVLHGFKGFRQWGFFPWISERLASSDLAVCRFDFSRNGVGESGEEFDRLDLFADDSYSQQLRDVEAVCRWIGEHDFVAGLPAAILGHSRGGAVAILAARNVPNLRAVVTWSAIASVDRWDEATKRQWRKEGHFDIQNARTGQTMRMSTRILDDFEANRERLDVVREASRLDVPLLVVHGAKDESVDVGDAYRIAAAAANASTLIIASASHTFGAIHPLVRVPRELEIALEASCAFILNTVRGATLEVRVAR